MSDHLTVAKNHVVTFHYALSNADGKEVETSRSGDPVGALIGHDNMMPGLEEALLGRSAGDSFDATLQPKQAFGERREDWTQRVSKKYIANVARLKPGMPTQVQTDSGPRTVTVAKIGGKFIDVDLNHPLAGESVAVAVEIIDIREATAEEIAHGHVHGPGGHHH